MNKIKHGKIVKTFKTKRKTRGGKVVEVWLTVTVLKDEDGKPVQIATTERNLAWLPTD